MSEAFGTHGDFFDLNTGFLQNFDARVDQITPGDDQHHLGIARGADTDRFIRKDDLVS